MSVDMEHTAVCRLPHVVWVTVKGSVWVWETAPLSAAAVSNSLSHLGSFTHTFPTGMEPLQLARRGANGQHTRCHSAHMAAHLWRIYSTFIWILPLVSSSRTRIYQPNEGEWGGNRLSVCVVARVCVWDTFVLCAPAGDSCGRCVRVPGL